MPALIWSLVCSPPDRCPCGRPECREEAVPERCRAYRAWPRDNRRPGTETEPEMPTTD